VTVNLTANTGAFYLDGAVVGTFTPPSKLLGNLAGALKSNENPGSW